jgi:hydrogenase maturation protease
MTTRIICYGNQWYQGDQIGRRVFERLQQLSLPPGVELADGGISGLNGVRLFENIAKAVVVDAIPFAGQLGRVHRLGVEDIVVAETPLTSHSVGLGLLLYTLPDMIPDSEMPEIVIYGMESVEKNFFTEQEERDIDQGMAVLVQRVLEETRVAIRP